MDFVGGCVYGGNTRLAVWCHSGLLIGIFAILKLDDLANEHSFGVSGIGTWKKTVGQS